MPSPLSVSCQTGTEPMATSLTHSAVGTPRFRLLIVIVPLSWVMVGATKWAVNATPRRDSRTRGGNAEVQVADRDRAALLGDGRCHQLGGKRNLADRSWYEWWWVQPQMAR